MFFFNYYLNQFHLRALNNSVCSFVVVIVVIVNKLTRPYYRLSTQVINNRHKVLFVMMVIDVGNFWLVINSVRNTYFLITKIVTHDFRLLMERPV